ncbi:folylpolyglutamate synthase/dihydrofolate synthase family protein [Dactylosporangium sp. AC04546]|uniref:bifunctional folylpolyglutamate synthase/dihydrofolate synthase n=1 Tax=Dactylosporangium sp. AC04546 TaxID=2862460 RepID=UPI001EDDF489|nr:folylpolyglutamate synthase/dihydrofolate synthase family protein [Dactylosporangium sp. AC04546]WVK89814.1 folylpolyglutamate synthase/dihydrofolate synthase family protein [Dactylosporangium sp. AC04546]
MVFDLSRIEALLDSLGSPQRAYPAIHLTGTNGKTSTARMIDSLLRAHGLRTGRYTSPHLQSVTERISIEGAPISEERFVEVYEEVAPLAEYLDARSNEPLTYFDMTTAMAFAAFADAPVDVAVVEVGLGGADDSTNVLQAQTTVITPIGLDHTEWLGDTIEDIALAKAGIVHKGSTLICALQPEEAMRPILERCAEVGAAVAREGREFGVVQRDLAVGGQVLTLQGLSGVYEGIFLPLHGEHQAQNAAIALAAVEAFLGAGTERALNAEAVRDGFAGATSPGRLERVRNSPPILLDAAHNAAGMQATVKALTEEFAFAGLVAVVAALADKDVEGMLELLEPITESIVVTRNSSPRAMSAAQLGALAEELFGPDRVHVVPDFPDAIDTAVTLAESDNAVPGTVGILITGSVVTVADARGLLKR